MAEDTRVLYREAPAKGAPTGSGRALKIELDSGKVYDEHDRLVERWSAADNNESELLADFVDDRMFQQSVYAMSRVDRERALAMAATRGYDEKTIRMDLAPSDVHIPSAIPNYASGYRNMPPVADMVLPPLLVPKKTDDYFQWAKEDAFQRAQPIGSADGGEVAEISPRLSNASFQTKSRALGSWVSGEVTANADAPLNPMQAAAIRVMNAMTIERELRAQGLLFNSSNFDASVVTTLGGTANWDGGATSDPIKDLQNATIGAWGYISAILMGRQTWFAFLRNPNVQKYFTFKSNSAPMPTPEEAQKMLDLPPIIVGKMQYINASGAKVDVWNGSVLGVQQPEQMPPVDQESVATALTFRWNGAGMKPNDGVMSGGYIVRRFFTQNRGELGGEKIVVVSFDAEKVTSQFAAFLITGAYT